MARLGIAGAGLLGRLLAWQLGRAGHKVSVFDPAAGPAPAYDGQGAAGFSAAGMLSPTAERERADEQVAALGWRSIALWRGIAEALEAPGLLSERGSVLLAHRSDRGSAERMLARCGGAQPIGTAMLAELEPALQGAAHAWWLPGEAQIDPCAMLQRLFEQAPDTVRWHWGAPIATVEAGALHTPDGERLRFDRVFDVRGLGARAASPGLQALRGVRGETVWLQLPGHGLTRPVRLLHPRHAVYLVPRGPERVFVGASEIESEDRSPVSLRSAVELMAAAHSVMPALAEARIERLDRNLRPALPDHRALSEVADGVVRINGLFRHGWLVAPALVQDSLAAAGLLQEDLHA